MVEFTTDVWVLIGLGVILLVGSAILFFINYSKTHFNPAKRKKRVSSALRSFSRLRNYKVLDNVKIGDVTIDHILVGYFGMICVNDLCNEGFYYGELSDSNWVCSDPPEKLEKKGKLNRMPISNPLFNGEKAIKVIRENLSKNGIYKIQIDNITVISNRSAVVQITGAKEKVMNLKGLSDLLSKSKYSSDAGLDVDKLCKAITESK